MGQASAKWAQLGLFLFCFSKFYVLELNTVLVFGLHNYGICKQCLILFSKIEFLLVACNINNANICV
jgi:hypothetical protein